MRDTATSTNRLALDIEAAAKKARNNRFELDDIINPDAGYETPSVNDHQRHQRQQYTLMAVNKAASDITTANILRVMFYAWFPIVIVPALTVKGMLSSMTSEPTQLCVFIGLLVAAAVAIALTPRYKRRKQALIDEATTRLPAA